MFPPESIQVPRTPVKGIKTMSSIGKIRRLLNLLERLQSGRVYTSAELADLCSVSRRTIFRDIKTLQEAGIPILYDASKQGYWISSPTYLPPTNLTLTETLSLLVLAQETGSSDRGIPFQETARDAAMKLQSNLPAHLGPAAGELTDVIKIQSEPLADLSNGHAHYERLLDGLTSRRKVRIRYESLAEQSEIQTLLCPYRLLFRRHTWYVIGRSSLHRSVRTFHIGRVKESVISDDEFQIPPRFSLKKYFGNAWNLIREKNSRVNVTVRFQPLVAQNVAEVCWHPTQQLEWNNDGTLNFTVNVDGIHEISWWILSYGDQARVLEPASLCELLRNRAKKMLEQYTPRTNVKKKKISKKKSAASKTKVKRRKRG